MSDSGVGGSGVSDSGVGEADDFSAVAVPVTAADPIVGRHRAAFDQSATWGVPPHITVLVPFVPPEQIDASVINELAAAVASVAAFDCTFASTAWFGEDVVWLAPEPSEPFRALTDAVVSAFPAYRPYGGTVDDPIPHLTIGTADQGSVEQLRHAEADVRAALPLHVRIDHALLIAGNEARGSWHTLATLPLGGAC